MTLSHAPYAALTGTPPKRNPLSFSEPLSPFGNIGQVGRNTAEEVALATRCVNRYATDTRDADRLKLALGLTATYPTLKETHK